MPLLFHPQAGTILICDYPKDLRAPEMVKRRPVIVVSPKLKHRNDLVTVVPLSTTRPRIIMPYHHELTLNLPNPWDSAVCWAICDHPITVCFSRLNLIRGPKDRRGKRVYIQKTIVSEDLLALKSGLAAALGIEIKDK